MSIFRPTGKGERCTMGGMSKSTRISIVERALLEAIERISDLDPSPETSALRAKALTCERTVRTWGQNPPTEEQRAAMLKAVLDLNVEVMGLSRRLAK